MAVKKNMFIAGAEGAEGARKGIFRAFGRLFKGERILHSDHDAFTKGLSHKKKLKLAYFSKKLGQNTLKVCAPLHYSEGKNHSDGLDCYYFWDYKAESATRNLLALSPMQILGMELTQESFDIREFGNVHKEPAHLRPEKAQSEG